MNNLYRTYIQCTVLHAEVSYFFLNVCQRFRRLLVVDSCLYADGPPMFMCETNCNYVGWIRLHTHANRAVSRLDAKRTQEPLLRPGLDIGCPVPVVALTGLHIRAKNSGSHMTHTQARSIRRPTRTHNRTHFNYARARARLMPPLNPSPLLCVACAFGCSSHMLRHYTMRFAI